MLCLQFDAAVIKPPGPIFPQPFQKGNFKAKKNKCQLAILGTFPLRTVQRPERAADHSDTSSVQIYYRLKLYPQTIGKLHVTTCLLISPTNVSYCSKFAPKYLLTPRSRVLPEKLTGSQLVKNFPAFYVTQKFITTFTRAGHMSLSWASSIQSIHPHPTFWRLILILFSHLRLGLPSGLFSSGFPTKTQNASPLPIRATYPAHLILLDFITRTILDEVYRLLSSSLCSFLQSPVPSSLLGPNIHLNTIFLNTLSLHSSLNEIDQVSHP